MSITSDVAAAFAQVHGRHPDGLFAAPGRVNLIGEHTDYNDGFVLPFALSQHVVVAADVAVTARTSVRSLRQPDEVAEFSAATVAPGDVEGWSAYVAGVFWSLRASGHHVPDVDLVLDGDVPPGAGLSSSAALECAIGVALNDLGVLGLDRTSLARAAQRAENDFVGAPTGLMDQMASMHGRADHLVFLDTRSLAVRHIPFRLAENGLVLLVIDSSAPHALVDGRYAERRADCERAAQCLGVPTLRDIELPALDDALGRLDDDTIRRRARHVVTENARVLSVMAALRSGADPRVIGPALTASHRSMRDDFQITVAPVDLAVDVALAEGAHGARMTGGGFGGCVLALVDTSDADRIYAAVEVAFAEHEFAHPERIPATPSAGAGLIP